MKTTCQNHGIALVSSNTKYGRRWQCPVPGCTVACWGGSTSTPADGETRRARMRFHAMFDPLWKRGGVFRKGCGPGRARYLAYGWLARSMGLPREVVHGGMFTLEQCLRACEIIETMETPA